MTAEHAGDVPVNKVTSFHGQLSQFIHTPADEVPSEQTTPCLKRKSTPASDSTGDSRAENNLQVRRSKRSRQGRGTSIDEMPYLSPRSLSSSVSIASPASLPTTRLTAPTLTNTPTPERKSQRRGRGRQRNPESPASSPTPSSPLNLLRDSIPPNLVLLMVGVNPGIMTGTTGYAYAHPSNRFWKLLHSSGITSMLHPPSDTYRLPELYSVGNTNIVSRPTRDASVLSKAEMNAGVPVLEAKVAAQRPEAVCLVGKGIWEAVWRVRKGRAIRKEEFRYGWQNESENMGRVDGPGGWPGAPVFVATTTSGVAATMSMQEKEAVWRELGGWVVRRREERKRNGCTGIEKSIS